MRPDYQESVERLWYCTPAEIYEEWNSGSEKHPLFRNIPKLGGCLTEIKAGVTRRCVNLDNLSVLEAEFAQRIRDDSRIPNPLDWKKEIDPKFLIVFAEWNERIDNECPSLREV